MARRTPAPCVTVTPAERATRDAYVAESVRLQADERVNARAARIERLGLEYVEAQEARARALAERHGVRS